MGNIVTPFKQQQPSFAYQPLTVPLLSVEAQNENLKVFRFTDLKKVTKNFKKDRVVECENGSVRNFYKGYIDETTFAPSRTETGIAVSVMELECDRSCSLQDWMEIVRSLEHISHPNLVKLLGYCCEDNKSLFLVFEHSHRVRLDSRIFGKDEEEALSWEIRIKIAIGTAQGLAFLHSINKFPINREIRMHNIMLDEMKVDMLEYSNAYLLNVSQQVVSEWSPMFTYLV
ncbi:PREDICTED: putative inactive serine/threonine-protein kinase At5g11400 isoform X2 [Camelina sativa]|uniref:Inactive serine/threonine-protein kinase At5g11400 isoform X2 n=1 Tax=Camelina sativa TaxID=90675 RepID=A0ABM1QAI3_CAMSA|nr:PREDICTED: putative inactive serine/threonine-protein kinase At5g11400 isoform X2 [Camelina sativa]